VSGAVRQADCPIKYKLEMEVPQWAEWNNEWYGNFQAVRAGEFGANLQVNSETDSILSLSQQEFLDDWSHRYAYTSTDPSSYIKVKFRYTAWDASRQVWESQQFDEFEVEIRASAETKSSFCDWTALAIADPISGTRTYDINPSGEEPDLLEVFVSTAINGDAGEGCLDQLRMDLEISVGGNYWLPIQSGGCIEEEQLYRSYSGDSRGV
jgi:hypothetical protein